MNAIKTLRILFTGGGTGGHVFPILAVAEALQIQAEQYGVNLEMRYFGSAHEYAPDIVTHGINFVPILSSKWRRYWSLQNFLDLIKFFLSIPQLLWRIFWFMPDIVFSKGGPGALAIVLVSRFYLIPVIIHESDSVPGLTNVISGRLAKKIFLGFASAGAYFSTAKIEIVGNPVRASLFQTEKDRAQAKRSFGFNPDQPLIVILGGSQGAEQLNTFILENLDPLANQFQILHQVGQLNYEEYKKEVGFVTKYWDDAQRSRYQFYPFFRENAGDALLAADIIISRGGGGSIFEIAAFGKPSILVPLPTSANGHQQENSRLYAQVGSALLIDQENLLGNLLADKINDLLRDPNLLQKMASAARSFYRPDSADLIAKHLLTYI